MLDVILVDLMFLRSLRIRLQLMFCVFKNRIMNTDNIKMELAELIWLMEFSNPRFGCPIRIKIESIIRAVIPEINFFMVFLFHLLEGNQVT